MYEGCRVEEGWERGGGSKGLRKGEGREKRIGQGKKKKKREKGQDIVGGRKGGEL